MNAMHTAVPDAGSACAQRWRSQPYRERLTLADTRQVLLRPVHHRDADGLARFFAALSPQARLLRFHGAVNRLPEPTLRAMATQVPQRHVVLVALADADDGATPVVAEARYAIGSDGQPEFAVAVADAWQRQGLGRALVQRLAIHARASGLRTLRGAVMPGNEAMLQLMAGLGARLHSEAAEVQATLRL